jgi:hypothetical protein
MPPSDEEVACTPVPIERAKFNPAATIPFGLTVEHIEKAMQEFSDFLCLINVQLHSKQMLRLESILMPANFSSMVGEFIMAAIPKQCVGLVRNGYHNGHPDLIPAGMFPGNSTQYADKGIEIKGSRYASGWQGHNPEACWLMVFVFDSNRPKDEAQGLPPRPFQFNLVAGAELAKSDWTYSGRKKGSRRTITAAVAAAGCAKMKANWIYKDMGKGRK